LLTPLSTKYSAPSLLFFSLWKDVTFNLKIRDIDAATEAKHRLEERQRAEARERKEKEIQWETRVSLFWGACLDLLAAVP